MISDLVGTIRNTKNKWRFLKTVKDGLFLRDSTLDHIADKYAKHVRTAYKRKIRRKTAHSEIMSLTDNQLNYLDAPNFLWTGYFVPVKKSLTKGIPSSAGKIVSCHDFLHHQDPMFEGHRNIKLLENGDNTAEFIISDETYQIPNTTFYFFSKQWREEKKSDNLRDCMLGLYRRFKNSEPEEDKPEHRTYRSWAFVLENNVLKQCSRKGK